MPIQSFETAKLLLSLMSILGWLVVASSLYFIVALEPDLQFLPRVAVSAVVAFQGILIVAGSQMGLAQVATAENTRDMLIFMRASHSQSNPISDSQFNRQTSHLSNPAGMIKSYKGYAIIQSENGVSVEDQNFGNVIEAEKWINKNWRG